ncbi:glycosyltransferase [Microbacterium sp. ProA8]|uniref:glycosyltransferase n=1 Tax=Microbacterium chionoecetis TaxID=3153754 RepID=UPI00326576B2
MRVLRISHSAAVADWRGRERGLRARGLHIDLLSARRWHAGGAETDLTLDAGEQAVAVDTWGRHPALFVYDPRPLWRVLGGTYDVIDVHEEPFALATAEVLLLRRLRRNRAPVVLYTAQNLHKRYPPPFRWFERHALRRASGVSACNTEAARIAENKGFPGRARVIPLGVDLGRYAPQPEAPEHRDTIVVGFLGRLVAEKGLQTLLDAAALEPRLRLRIAGAGPLAAELRAAAAARGLADRVDLVGPIDPDAVPAFYTTLHVLAVPSVPRPGWTEQFGRVAVEAMASGIPVVSSDAGALPDVVGGAGLVVPAGDAGALARALVEASTTRARELREAGLARAAECSWDAVAHAYSDLYRSVTSRDEPAPAGEAAAMPRAAVASADGDGMRPAERRPLEIVVVAFGAPDLLRRALEPVRGLPVTVVDNSSLPEIAALCEALGVRYLDPGRNGGFAAGVNVALRDRLVPGADVLLLNPDAVISADAIAVLHDALAADPGLASVAPVQTDDGGRPARVAWPFPSPGNAWLEAVGLGRWQCGARYVIGSVLLLRAEALDQVGEFDERFFLYAEETDWAYRAHLLGWRHAVVEEARALHEGAATSTDPRRREAHFFASQERFYRKHYGAAGWQAARAAVWLGAAVRSVLLRGERASAARRRAATFRGGPVRAEAGLDATPVS